MSTIHQLYLKKRITHSALALFPLPQLDTEIHPLLGSYTPFLESPIERDNGPSNNVRARRVSGGRSSWQSLSLAHMGACTGCVCLLSDPFPGQVWCAGGLGASTPPAVASSPPAPTRRSCSHLEISSPESGGYWFRCWSSSSSSCRTLR